MELQPRYYVQPDHQMWPAPPYVGAIVDRQPNHVLAPSLCLFDGRQLHCYNQPCIEWIPVFLPVPNCAAYPVYFDPNAAQWLPEPNATMHCPMYSPAPFLPPLPMRPPFIRPCDAVPIMASNSVNAEHDVASNGNSIETCATSSQPSDNTEYKDIDAVQFEQSEFPYLMFLKNLEYSLSMQSCRCNGCMYSSHGCSDAATDGTEYSAGMWTSDFEDVTDTGELNLSEYIF